MCVCLYILILVCAGVCMSGMTCVRVCVCGCIHDRL